MIYDNFIFCQMSLVNPSALAGAVTLAIKRRVNINAVEVMKLPEQPKLPLVSIIMPAYNSASTIERAINSVLRQTYKAWELLIVDDCSTDSTPQILEVYQKISRRIRVVRNRANSGPAISRNKALQLAAGSYVAFLDADDLWLPEKLSVQVKWLELHSTKICVFSGFYVLRADGEELRIHSPMIHTGRLTLQKLQQHNFIPNLTGMYSVERCRGVFYQSDQLRHEDYAMWLEVLRNGDAYGLGDRLAVYQKSSSSLSSNKIKSQYWHWLVIRAQNELTLGGAIVRFLQHLAWHVYTILDSHIGSGLRVDKKHVELLDQIRAIQSSGRSGSQK